MANGFPSVWVPVYKVATFAEVKKVYKRAGRGQGSGQGVYAGPPGSATLPISALKGFLRVVQIAVSGENIAAPGSAGLPAWLRLAPNVEKGSWQNYQADVTNIPGVRPLRDNGKWVNYTG